MKLLHRILFWSHLLAGVIAGIIIFVMSATGFILMYEHQLVEYADRDMRKVVPSAANAPRLSLDEIVAKARAQKPNIRPTGVVLRNDPTASVAVGFGREGAVYVNPYSGAVLGSGSKLHDSFHGVIDWHRWLGMEGEGRAVGRAITGACNLAFLWLALSGVYLWWPRSWHCRGLKPSLLFNFRLRGKARDWNWHNVIGFWSSGVLVVLTLTAAVMSYQWANNLLYTLTGSEPPPRAQGTSPMAQMQQARAGGEPRERKPLARFDEFRTQAQQQVPGWVLMMIRLPRGDGPVNVLIQESQAPHMFARSQLALDRSTAEIVEWAPYAAANTGRKLRLWVRGLHTGEALGLAGQTVAGLASLGGCFLVWTGFAMGWRRFRYRKREAGSVAMSAANTAPLETAPAAIQPDTQIDQISTEASTIEMEGTNPSSTNGDTHNGHTATDWSMAPFNGASAVVLYATVTGNAELLAKRLAEELHAEGITAYVRDMAQCQPSLLMRANFVLMVVSTYGDGEPPDDAVPFWEAVVHGNSLDLRGVSFSVLALGNTTYDRFCQCGRDFDLAMERHGARRIYPRVDCDVDYDAPAKQWFDGVLSSLRQTDHATMSV